MTTLALLKAGDVMPEDSSGNSDGETAGLGQRLGQELLGMGAYYCRDGQSGILEQTAKRAQEVPPARVSWRELAALSDKDADAGAALWEAVTREARRELDRGAWACDALATAQDTPMDRARFFVVRRAFVEEWQPRGGIEGALIDQMAQAHTQQMYWTSQVTERTRTSAAQDLREQTEKVRKEDKHWKYGEWIPPRVCEADAVDNAMAMIDKWNRLFVRTLRQLRDLRRYTPIVIASAGQVNVGGQQVNMSAQGQAKEVRRPKTKRRSK